MFLYGVLPGKHLSPNRGERKQGREPFAISADKATLRARVHQGLVESPEVRAVGTMFGPSHVVLTLRWYKRKRGSQFYRPSDTGNACYALKAAIDGIKDAEIIEDDDYVCVPMLTTIVERCDSYLTEGIGITVIELEVGA